MPDRLVLLPWKVGFVEVKARRSRPLQVSRHNLLRSLGLQVLLDDITAIRACWMDRKHVTILLTDKRSQRF